MLSPGSVRVVDASRTRGGMRRHRYHRLTIQAWPDLPYSITLCPTAFCSFGLHAGQQAGQYRPPILTGMWSVSALWPQASQFAWCLVDCKQSLPLDGVHSGRCEPRDIGWPSVWERLRLLCQFQPGITDSFFSAGLRDPIAASLHATHGQHGGHTPSDSRVARHSCLRFTAQVNPTFTATG